MEGHADVGEQLAAPAHEEETATKQVACGPHATGIDIGHGKGTASVDGLHVEGAAENEGNVLLGAEVGEPVPAEDALDADDEVIAIGRDGPEEALGLRAQVAVHEHLAGLVVEDAQVHGASVKVDPAVVSMLASIEAHGSPPGSDEWVALSSFPSKSERSRRGLHQDQAIATDAGERAPGNTARGASRRQHRAPTPLPLHATTILTPGGLWSRQCQQCDEQ
jgi:hypothetical protein